MKFSTSKKELQQLRKELRETHEMFKKKLSRKNKEKIHIK